MPDDVRKRGCHERRLAYIASYGALLCACGGRSADRSTRPLDAADAAIAGPGASRLEAPDGGADVGAERPAPDEIAHASCGPSFAGAAAAHPGERLCQTLTYRPATGYCASWRPCSRL